MKDNQITVLHVIGGMNMGGAETFLMNIYRAIDRNKYKFIFLCYGNDRYDYEKEIKKLNGIIVRIKKPKPIFDPSQINIIKKIIKQYNIDVVHAHTYYNSMYAVIAARKMKVSKIIVHSHNTKSGKKLNLIQKTYIKISKQIINHKDVIKLACGKDAGDALFTDKFSVIENGIDINKYLYSKENRNDIRGELGIPKKAIVIGHVGRFFPVKNHKFIISVFSKLKDKKYILLLVGDGPLKKNIEDRSKQYKIEERIIFTGNRHDINKIYSAMDIFVFPSLYEGLPVSLIEAQANGLKILASNKIDKSCNIEGRISFIEINNVDKWKSAILNCETNRIDPNKLKKSDYDINNTVKKMEKYYG